MKLLDRLLWPNMWIAVFAATALLGLLSIAVGLLVHVAWLSNLGIWLEIPILASGVILALVVIPILIYLNRKGGRKM